MKKITKFNPSWKNLTIFEENPSISMSSKIFVKIHAVLRKIENKTIKKKKIAHVPYCPCALPPRYPISMCNINHPFTHMPHCPCAPLPMCHIANLSKRCQAVKKMSSCQKDVKCQKVKHMDYGGGSQKN